MTAEQISNQIAYLDEFPDTVETNSLPPNYVAGLRAAIQLELAKQAHWPDVEDVAMRVALLESRVAAMRGMVMASRKRSPVVVQYVVSHKDDEENEAPPFRRGFPKSLVVFYSLGLLCSIGFAILLALPAFGINPGSPFLALLGFMGGVGWLTTAWTDLLLLKAGTSWRTKLTSTRKSNEHREALAQTGSR